MSTGEEILKIAIAVTSVETDAQIAEHAARAPYYRLYDSATGLSEVLSNPVAGVERVAGPQAAEFLIAKGVSQVVAGRFGPKFRSELEGSGINCQERNGLVSELLTLK